MSYTHTNTQRKINLIPPENQSIFFSIWICFRLQLLLTNWFDDIEALITLSIPLVLNLVLHKVERLTTTKKKYNLLIVFHVNSFFMLHCEIFFSPFDFFKWREIAYWFSLNTTKTTIHLRMMKIMGVLLWWIWASWGWNLSCKIYEEISKLLFKLHGKKIKFMRKNRRSATNTENIFTKIVSVQKTVKKLLRLKNFPNKSLFILW